MEKKQLNTVVIGAGQSGLTAAYYLKKNNETYVVLVEGKNVGDSWRLRWDSLRLFTPSEHDGLPGLPFPARRGSIPTNEMMAAFYPWHQLFGQPVINLTSLGLN